jgi:hypothetical protein
MKMRLSLRRRVVREDRDDALEETPPWIPPLTAPSHLGNP